MSIQQAEHWLKNVISGQPLHREDLGDENSSSGTLKGVSPVTLQLAPQLRQELTQELANAPTVDLGPQISVPGMSPGGNMVRGPGGVQNRTPKPPTKNSDE